MRYSSAKQLSFDLEETAGGEVFSAQAPIDAEIDNRSAPPLLMPSSELSPANRGSAYAITSRLAGRINAASISELEHEELLRERQRLLDKKFNRTMTRKEANRLEYVRWSLDRIEDAQHGAALEALENYVSRYEQFADELRSLERRLRDRLPGRRHP
jgi:hypothetical protein